MKKFKIKKSTIILLLLNILTFTLVFSYFTSNDGSTNENGGLTADSNAAEWRGEQEIERGKSATDKIAIPGWDCIYIKSDTTSQKVNFYNPQENNCLFLITLYIEDEDVWKSGYIKPGYGYYDITLSKEFKPGEYTGGLKIRCFKESGEELNSAKVTFKVIVQGDKR